MTTVLLTTSPGEALAESPAEVTCGCDTLGYITRFDALFEVLEVVAPYDLAYLPSLAEAVAYFECLARDSVTLRPA